MDDRDTVRLREARDPNANVGRAADADADAGIGKLTIGDVSARR